MTAMRQSFHRESFIVPAIFGVLSKPSPKNDHR
jgi:hypothetical protein